MSERQAPIRILVVAGQGVHLSLSSFREAFTGLDGWATPDDASLPRVIGDVDPHVIVSMGDVPTSSALWQMPLWRRRVWLNLPDNQVGPHAVKMSALSLLGATIDDRFFRDSPLLSVVPLRQTAADLVAVAKCIATNQSYDNIELLVAEELWSEALDQLRDDPVLLKMRRAAIDAGSSPFQLLREAACHARGDWLWPVATQNPTAQDDFIEKIIGQSADDVTAVVTAEDSSPQAILDYLAGNTPNRIGHLVIRRAVLASMREFIQAPPMTSLGHLIACLLADSRTTIHGSDGTETLDDDVCRNEEDDVRGLLLQAPIAWARHQLVD